MAPLPCFSKVIGTGGIGSGILYRLEGNHTLGRNESRMAHLLPTRDFCKQHIILHYVSRLLKDLRAHVAVLPVGGVGSDSEGARMRQLMRHAGMNVARVKVIENAPTLGAVCFLYPDNSGGNITESRSASSRVSREQIAQVEKEFKHSTGRCMVLCAPEVPLAARIHLLSLGRKYGAYNTASFVSGEMPEVKRRRLLRFIDLLAVNIDEAAQLGGVSHRAKPERIINACIASATRVNPLIQLSITNGVHGSYSYERGTLNHLPALKVPVQSTAGAGDAFLSGLMLGALRGLSFHGNNPATGVRLGRLISSMSIISPDTIDFNITLTSLKAFAGKHGEQKVVDALHE